ncbi:Adenylate cyclase type 9 [Blyttiomyces sp. JEL0837]|nr:Adenylate cyclase type 9 [Blyttiomyces sp. JEL0837]
MKKDQSVKVPRVREVTLNERWIPEVKERTHTSPLPNHGTNTVVASTSQHQQNNNKATSPPNQKEVVVSIAPTSPSALPTSTAATTSSTDWKTEPTINIWKGFHHKQHEHTYLHERLFPMLSWPSFAVAVLASFQLLNQYGQRPDTHSPEILSKVYIFNRIVIFASLGISVQAVLFLFKRVGRFVEVAIIVYGLMLVFVLSAFESYFDFYNVEGRPPGVKTTIGTCFVLSIGAIGPRLRAALVAAVLYFGGAVFTAYSYGPLMAFLLLVPQAISIIAGVDSSASIEYLVRSSFKRERILQDELQTLSKTREDMDNLLESNLPISIIHHLRESGGNFDAVTSNSPLNPSTANQFMSEGGVYGSSGKRESRFESSGETGYGSSSRRNGSVVPFHDDQQLQNDNEFVVKRGNGRNMATKERHVCVLFCDFQEVDGSNESEEGEGNVVVDDGNDDDILCGVDDLELRDAVKYIRKVNTVLDIVEGIVRKHGGELIKSMGTKVLIVCGIKQLNDKTDRTSPAKKVERSNTLQRRKPVTPRDTTETGFRIAKEIFETFESRTFWKSKKIYLKAGMHTGAISAAIIGEYKFAYDVFGDTVNIASRMLSMADPWQVMLTQEAAERLDGTTELKESEENDDSFKNQVPKASRIRNLFNPDWGNPSLNGSNNGGTLKITSGRLKTKYNQYPRRSSKQSRGSFSTINSSHTTNTTSKIKGSKSDTFGEYSVNEMSESLEDSGSGVLIINRDKSNETVILTVPEHLEKEKEAARKIGKNYLNRFGYSHVDVIPEHEKLFSAGIERWVTERVMCVDEITKIVDLILERSKLVGLGESVENGDRVDGIDESDGYTISTHVTVINTPDNMVVDNANNGPPSNHSSVKKSGSPIRRHCKLPLPKWLKTLFSLLSSEMVTRNRYGTVTKGLIHPIKLTFKNPEIESLYRSTYILGPLATKSMSNNMIGIMLMCWVDLLVSIVGGIWAPFVKDSLPGDGFSKFGIVVVGLMMLFQVLLVGWVFRKARDGRVYVVDSNEVLKINEDGSDDPHVDAVNNRAASFYVLQSMLHLGRIQGVIVHWMALPATLIPILAAEIMASPYEKARLLSFTATYALAMGASLYTIYRQEQWRRETYLIEIAGIRARELCKFELEKSTIVMQHTFNSRVESLLTINRRAGLVQKVDRGAVLAFDIVGFTVISSSLSAGEVMKMLNDIYRDFDFICETLQQLPKQQMATAPTMPQSKQQAISQNNNSKQQIIGRIGIHTGPICCALIGGTVKLKYDVVGTSVELATQLEQTALPGTVHVGYNTFLEVGDAGVFIERDESGKLAVRIHGQGGSDIMQTGAVGKGVGQDGGGVEGVGVAEGADNENGKRTFTLVSIKDL